MKPILNSLFLLAACPLWSQEFSICGNIKGDHYNNNLAGKKLIAIGNSLGDYIMLQYIKNSPYSLQMIVNHDDSIREYYYDTEKMKKLCVENGWHEISMKNDFKEIFNDWSLNKH